MVVWWARRGEQGKEGLHVIRKAWELWAKEVSDSACMSYLCLQQNDMREVPVVFVRASELPKGALVEFQVNMHTERRVIGAKGYQAKPGPNSRSGSDWDSDEEPEEEIRVMYHPGIYQEGSRRYEQSVTEEFRRTVLATRTIAFMNKGDDLRWCSHFFDRTVGLRIYHLASVYLPDCKSLQQLGTDY